MADESILDQALALIPGVGTKKKRTPPTRQQQLSAIQKNLAKVTKDVEKVAAIITGKATMAKKVAKTTARKAPTPKRATRRTTKRKAR